MNFVPPWNITRKRLKGAIDAKGYGWRGERENLTQPNEDKWGGNENNYWARLALAHAPLLFQSLGVACPANFYTAACSSQKKPKPKNKIPVHTEAKKLRSNWWWNWRFALLDGRERLDCLGAFLPTFPPLRLLYSSCIIITFARSSLNLFLLDMVIINCCCCYTVRHNFIIVRQVSKSLSFSNQLLLYALLWEREVIHWFLLRKRLRGDSPRGGPIDGRRQLNGNDQQ